MSTTTTQIVQEAPDIQEYKLGLYNTGQDFIMRMQGLDPETGQQVRKPIPSPEERLRANNPQFGQPARGFDQHQIDARRNNDD